MSQHWTRTFINGATPVSGKSVYWDMYDLARRYSGRKVTVSWIPRRTEELFSLSPPVRAMVQHYRKSLPRHLADHGVAMDALTELRTEVFALPPSRMYVRAYAQDDRGEEHVAFISI